MPWGAVAGAVIGTVGSAIASGNAADAQQAAADKASSTQLQMYNQTRTDQAPWRQAGGQAVNALAQFYGLPGGQGTSGPSASGVQGYDPSSGYAIGAGGGFSQLLQTAQGQIHQTAGQGMPATTGQPQQPAAPVDYNALLSKLPGYQFQMDQGTEAVQRNLAARGLLQSGAAGKALTQYGQGLASNYATQYVNGLQSLAGIGQTSVGQTGAFGANAANQIGSNQIYAGNAQASGYANTFNGINAGLSGVGQAYGYMQQQQADRAQIGYAGQGYGSSADDWVNSSVGYPSSLGGP